MTGQVSEDPRRFTTSSWQPLVDRWCYILGLPELANNSTGGDILAAFTRAIRASLCILANGRLDGWARPTQKSTGGIVGRIKAFGISPVPSDAIEVLVAARRVMNTESDCFVQTPGRLIIVECKDKIGFTNEQRARQQKLGEYLGVCSPGPTRWAMWTWPG